MKTFTIFTTLFLLLVRSAFAQDVKPASIAGTVKDARTKLPLAEAVITLTSNAFTGQRFALTNSTGMYLVRQLPAGNYTIGFEMEGYRKFVQENVVLKPGMSLGVSFQMIKDRKVNQVSTTAPSDSNFILNKQPVNPL